MVADLAVNISANIKDLQRNIGKAKATLKNFGSSATSIGATLSASVTLPIIGMGGVALKTASDFEQLEVRLQTLTGSAKAGRKQFELLQKFSAGTPFQLQDLVKANNTLLGFGLSAEDSFTALQQLGDVASATGADLQSIAVAFGQSSAEGKLFTRDIRQFINQGVPAVDLLAESMGVARSEVFTLAEEGKISFKVLQDAISQATSAGGKFAGATKAQSQTIAGLFSTLRDNVSLALGELGKEIVDALDLETLIKNATEKIQIITDVFKNLEDDVKRNLIGLAAVLGAAGPVAVALGGLAIIISSISLPVIGLVALISGLAYIFGSAFSQAGSFVGGFKLIFAKIVNGVIDDVIRMTGALSNLPFGVGSTFASITGTLIKFKADTKEQSDAFTPIADGVNLFTNTLSSLKTVITETSDALKNGIDTSAIEESLEGVKPSIPITIGQDIILDLDLDALGEELNKTVEGFNLDPGGDLFISQIGSINELTQKMRELQMIQSMVNDSEQYQLLQVAINAVQGEMDLLKGSTESMGGGLSILNSLATRFTDSFGEGMANVIVQGKKLEDILDNIGRLLLSSAIQTGIKILLTGGMKGTGFFSEGGGLFGNLFKGLGFSGSVASAVPTASMPSPTIVPVLSTVSNAGNSAQSFERALENYTARLGPNEFFALSQKGRLGY